MKGMTNSRPGVSVRSYLPSRSTTHACCCGTILKVWKMKIATMTAMTIEISIRCFRKGSVEWGRGQDEPIALDCGYQMLADLRGRSRRESRDPCRAAVVDECGPVRLPRGNV